MAKMFNGKPMKYWEGEAHKLVVDCLVRASLGVDVRSIIGKLASERLMELANAEDSELVKEVFEERDRCMEGFASIVNDITGG